MLNKALKSNFISGFLVFLIALPLCLGIAKASGFPPIAGIYTAIIGGLIVTFLTNAPLAVKGPAAGLIAIAISAVDELGGSDHVLGYKLTLAIVVVSGVVQVLFGFIKLGKLGDMFPVAVLRGMLAAIGIIIISKQIHIVMGVVPEAKSSLALLAEIPHSIIHANIEVAAIGFFSLMLLFLHPLVKKGFIKKLPAPLLVLAFAIPLGFVFDLSHEHDYDIGSLHFHIDPEQLLVRLPDSFLSGITFPDFSQITSLTSIKYIIMFALVGSIESVLSAKAVDAIDPKGRTTNLNQDLVAIGIGNTIAGFIGGLPMISEIVRSSANINNGAKGKMSNFFHGLFLFLFVWLAAAVIKSIPNAALAAMLVYTGFKLAAPKEFKRINSIGLDQILLFMTTLIVTLWTDLLLGVIVGILLKVIIELVQGVELKKMFNLDTQVLNTNDGMMIKLTGIASFLNYLKFKKLIDEQPKNQKITLDFNGTSFVDHTFLNNVHQIQNEFSKQGGELIKTGFNHHNFQSDHDLAARKLIVNPTLKGSTNELSNRAQAIQNMAIKNGLDFERKLSSSFIRPHLNAFSIISKFRRAKNIVIGTRDDYSFMVCDIVYDNVDDFLAQTSTATIAIIYNIARGGVPDFYTENESSLFNLSTRYEFELMPKSDKIPFKIFGEDTELVDSFFNPNLEYFISNYSYDIECQRRVILVHKGWGKISEGKSMDGFLSYVDALGEQVLKSK